MFFKFYEDKKIYQLTIIYKWWELNLISFREVEKHVGELKKTQSVLSLNQAVWRTGLAFEADIPSDIGTFLPLSDCSLQSVGDSDKLWFSSCDRSHIIITAAQRPRCAAVKYFWILRHCRMQAFWHYNFDIFLFWHISILHIMMHFPKDKHWFEWNLSCVAILRPAVVAGRQTTVLFFHFQ